VSRLVVLDSGPLSLISNPRGEGLSIACKEWLRQLLTAGRRVVLPEIADYEVRRELLRAGKPASIERLDELKNELEYLPITTDAMLLAAQFWAETRKAGRPTTSNERLDADVILAAQAALFAGDDDIVIATTNVRHLGRFVAASLWQHLSVN
jgi:predicted nucleic acid-binding protein